MCPASSLQSSKRKFRIERATQIGAVGQFRQRIMIGEMGDLLLEARPFGDVFMCADPAPAFDDLMGHGNDETIGIAIDPG